MEPWVKWVAINRILPEVKDSELHIFRDIINTCVLMSLNMCNYESLTSGSIRFMATHLTHDFKTNDSLGGLCFFSFGLNAIAYKYVVPV